MKTIIATIFILSACSAAPPSVRVIGGQDVTTQQFPYLVSIQAGISHTCSGTIVSPKWIVTAAHCAGISLIVSRVVAGTYNLTNVEKNDAVQIRYIDLYSVVKHPEYNDIDNDIALFKVTEPFDFNDNVQPLAISRVPCFADDEPTTFSGWGTQDGDSNVAAILQTADMTIVPFDQCQDIIFFMYANNLEVHQDIHICVTGAASPCMLDGGSPLVQDNRLIGLLSWLPATCSERNVPAIFTNTGYYKEFIKAHVDDLP